MHRFLLTVILMLGIISSDAAEIWWKYLCPELEEVSQQKIIAKKRLAALGIPVTGQTAVEVGYQDTRTSSPPLTPSWVQLDLRETKSIDTITLVPAVVGWHTTEQFALAFPVRFRVDISNDKWFSDSVAAGVFTEKDFPNPGIAPVTIKVNGKKARYVRLTVTKPARENRLYFFALSEIMVLSSNLNVAIGCPVMARGSVEIPTRFSKDYLVDGRSHLGPPIRLDPLKWDGLHSGELTNATPPWMKINLGREFSIQQVRLHPVHARIGADVPGFRFPKSFRVEASQGPAFAKPVLLFEAHGFSNPGDNPVTIPVANVEAQYIKVTALAENGKGGPRFSLSEVEVYSENKNVARSGKVERSSDLFSSSKNWPTSILVDGFTSFGQLVDLPVWLNEWEQRRTLNLELKRLDEREAILRDVARKRAFWINTSFIISCLIVGCWFIIAGRLRRQRELRSLRLRLARDIHDDIGSNLAGIAVLSEVARDAVCPHSNPREDWNEVNRIARDTLDAMREVLWLVGGREVTGLNLMAHLQLVATRMLSGKEVVWKSKLEHFPSEISLEARHQIFLFFKEALSNVVRHSGATRVELSAGISQKKLSLNIIDNGCGFDPANIRNGIGLNSQRIRAHSLHAKFEIHSTLEKGTSILLEIPLGKFRRRLPFIIKPLKFKKLHYGNRLAH